MTKLLGSILLFPLFVQAQSWQQLPQIDNPNCINSYLRPNTDFENLQSRYHLQKREDFDLKTDVSSFTEHIYFNSDTGEEMITRHYHFSDFGFLTLLEEDSIPNKPHSLGRKEIYTFREDSGELQKVERLAYGRQHVSSYSFDEKGYADEFVFRNLQELDWNVKSYPKGVFDYDCNYQWTQGRDCVYCDYTYLKEFQTFQRNNDGWRNFTFDIKHKRKQANPPPYPNNQYLGFLGHHPEYDSLKRIIRFEIIDFAVKSSYNIDQMYEFTYNEIGLLSSVKYSTNGPEVLYRLQYQYSIDYLAFDTYGNWTRKKVSCPIYFWGGDQRKEIYYEREIHYF